MTAGGKSAGAKASNNTASNSGFAINLRALRGDGSDVRKNPRAKFVDTIQRIYSTAIDTTGSVGKTGMNPHLKLKVYKTYLR